jgi:hypothetical protein
LDTWVGDIDNKMVSCRSACRTHSPRQRCWSLGVLLAVQLLYWLPLSAGEVRLREQSAAVVDGRILHCALVGGMEFSKPAIVDIDADGDPDFFVGDKDGWIRFFRNQGTTQDPSWDLVSDFYDSLMKERICPAFADIDDDCDPDLFVGNLEGRLVFFRNDGEASQPHFVRITDFYDSIDVGSESTPVFVDMDADSDLDLFVGKTDGRITSYHNAGTRQNPSWSQISDYYDSLDVGACSVPAFADIDADGDFDLFVGEDQGNINHFRNVGQDTLARWELVSASYNSIDVGRRSAPVFTDIDGDSDLDLFVGQAEGRIAFYRNDGSVYLPSWTPVTRDYLFLDFGAYSSPALADIDSDGDYDLFVGAQEGNINFCRTEEKVPEPAWTGVTANYFAIEADDYSSPAFADIDADGDLDLFIGRQDGKIDFYRNIGDPQSALWELIPNELSFVNAGAYVCPALVDIDADADLDLFVGQIHGKLNFYRNDGTPQFPSWTEPSEGFEWIDVGYYSSPAFGDLDLDGDFDMLIGNDEGTICLFENDGSAQAFSFGFVTDGFESIDVGRRSKPAVGDFDSDGDVDLFVGESKGGLHYYKNLTLNSVAGKVTDGTGPLEGEVVYLSGDREDSTITDSTGWYEFFGLPVGDYCVFLDPSSVQYCFFPLEADTFDVDFKKATAVGWSPGDDIPQHLRLSPNYPNPFNPQTNISYFLPSPAEVGLTIYNLRGEKVRQLVSGLQRKGWNTARWDGNDSEGKKVASGVYFCRLQTSGGCQTVRMVLLK